MATEHERGVDEICRTIEAICNRGDFPAADALFAPDYVNHGGLIPDLVRGPETVKVAVALYRAAFPDFTVTVVPLRARGATVLLRWAAGHRSRAGGLESTAAGVTGITRGRLVDGRIAESWTRWRVITGATSATWGEPPAQTGACGPTGEACDHARCRTGMPPWSPAGRALNRRLACSAP